MQSKDLRRLNKTVNIEQLRQAIDSNVISGSAPPGIFVGRFGYPKVYVGPMSPNFYGDTEILDTPEQWYGKSIDQIVDYRHSLVRGNKIIKVTDASSGGNFIEKIQELSMASKPGDLELTLTTKPSNRVTFNENSQPFGPSAPLDSMITPNISVDKRIEKSYYDRDLKAVDGIVNLYDHGVFVTKIQKAFSTGSIGIGKNRKMVPTRWSITAVDDTISKSLIKTIKQYPTIDEYRVYELKHLDNIYVTILLPVPWKFEWIEAWFPKTTWNQWGSSPYIVGDYEHYNGRKTYAVVGGCYYSTRLATAEALKNEKRQASAILLREIHPGYVLPVGVWNVRESIRQQLRTKPNKFDTLSKALQFAFSKLTVNSKHWTSNSTLLKEALYQKLITDF